MATRKKASKKTARKTAKKAGKKPIKKTSKTGRKKKAAGPGRKPRAALDENVSPAPANAPSPTAATALAERPEPRAVGATPEVFEALAAILAPYAHLFEAEMQPRMGYCLKTYGEWPSEIYFAGVQWTEAGVYFHLFPALRYPQLFEPIGPRLRGHQEGQVSFRFEALDPELREELAAVTESAFQCLRGEGLFQEAG